MGVMKLVFVAVCSLLVVVQGVLEPCKSDKDCNPGECCRDVGIFSRSGRCSFLKPVGFECELTDNIVEGIHDECPCAGGLSCQSQKYQGIFGIEFVRNACLKDDTEGSGDADF